MDRFILYHKITTVIEDGTCHLRGVLIVKQADMKLKCECFIILDKPESQISVFEMSVLGPHGWTTLVQERGSENEFLSNWQNTPPSARNHAQNSRALEGKVFEHLKHGCDLAMRIMMA